MDYTLEDLERAIKHRDAVEEKYARYDGNNPDKYRSERIQAANTVQAIEKSLKRDGLIPYTPQEQIEQQLDALLPNARKGDVVELDGKTYIRRFLPGSIRNGVVTSWQGYWVEHDPGSELQ
jgi:hypothetical protein